MQNKSVEADREIYSFSLLDFVSKFDGSSKRIYTVAVFLLILWLLPPTLFLSKFDRDPYVSQIQTQIGRGESVRESGLLPAFTRIGYLDPEPSKAFEHYCQIQCGLAPVLLIHDQNREYVLINAPKRPDSLLAGYAIARDFGRGLLLMKKVQ